VSDEGAGIGTEDLEHIFEPFYTKKKMGRRSGTGLGLAVVWNTIQEHGGTVTVSSDERGSTFTLFLPATQQTTKCEEQFHTDTDQDPCHSILVVDDEEQLRDIASQMLTALGYEVDCAISGEDAVDKVRDKSYALILLDMQMEPGINGLEAFRRLRSIRRKQKAVVTSGYAENEDVVQTLQLGALNFLKKPYSMEELKSTIGQALNEV
jgi:CheY-like chemotaxis protein